MSTAPPPAGSVPGPPPTLRDDLIPLLRCPVSRRPLRRASEGERVQLLAAWRCGRLTNRLGQTLAAGGADGIEAFLIADDRATAHVVRVGIVTLLPDETLLTADVLGPAS